MSTIAADSLAMVAYGLTRNASIDPYEVAQFSMQNGYYVNNASAWSLEDSVTEGDYVYAFVYTDAENYSDRYSYFDKVSDSAVPGDEISLVLTSLELDPSTWATVPTPLSGAVITIDGEDTEYITDPEGKVTIEAPEGLGKHFISAKDPNGIIAPPVFVVDI